MAGAGPAEHLAPADTGWFGFSDRTLQARVEYDRSPEQMLPQP